MSDNSITKRAENKMRIYLDVCCLNRPFDDQGQARVHLEAEAVLTILSLIQAGKWKMISSQAIDYEVANLLDWNRKRKIKMVLTLTYEKIKLNPKIEKRAKELEGKNFSVLDALHLAFAEGGNIDIFLTTDDKILKKAETLSLKLPIKNPVEWLMEVKKL